MDLSLKEMITPGTPGVNCIEVMTENGPLKIYYQGDLKDVTKRIFRDLIEFDKVACLRASDAIEKLKKQRELEEKAAGDQSSPDSE